MGLWKEMDQFCREGVLCFGLGVSRSRTPTTRLHPDTNRVLLPPFRNFYTNPEFFDTDCQA